MADFGPLHDGRPVIADQIFGWQSLQKIWENFATIQAFLDGLDVSGDGGALAAHLANLANPHAVTLAQVGAAPADHVGATGNAHGPATTSADGFMSRTHVASLSSALSRLAIVEGLPWHGWFRWNGGSWEAKKPKGLAGAAAWKDKGVADVRFAVSPGSPDDYSVSVTPGTHSKPIGCSVEKFSDRVLVFLWDTREMDGVDDVDFDIIVQPLF